MDFKTFKQYYDLGREETSLDAYLAASSKLDGDLSEDMLTNIYNLANYPISDTSAMSVSELSALYGIPERTLFAWNAGDRTPPDYVKTLIDYTLFNKEAAAASERKRKKG